MVQRAAIYARVSTDDQSCDRQVAELQQYAQRSGFDVVTVITETASGAKNNRLERQRVIELARKREKDLVIVSELSRWGRSTQDLLQTVQDLATRGVALRALNGPDLDTSTAQGELMLGLMSVISQFERSLLRERIKSGIVHARSKGTKSGLAIGRPVFDKSERVKRLLSQGLSVRAVATELGISKTTVMKVKSAT
ncbi:MAG: DNA resolvase [Cyanobacteria bacterium PR.023]|jgi:DNA invertase Pin-like site-specific DNA recombinase|nr:DNA resolvase [Cyanobacteria bacterium PR.023]